MSLQSKWLYIDTGARSGIYNMSFDNKLLKKNIPTEYEGVFRTYTWSPAAISLGRFQEASKVLNVEFCKKDNVDIVNRITGGGAIYHDKELTYSLVCSAEVFKDLTIKESYRKIIAFLIGFYGKLGYEAVLASETCPEKVFPESTDFCFSGVESNDILINTKKIGGNAQKRTRTRIFQHGSIPIKMDYDTISRYFKHDIADLGDKTVSLSDLKCKHSLSVLKHELKKSFQENLNIELINIDGK